MLRSSSAVSADWVDIREAVLPLRPFASLSRSSV